MGNYFSFLHQRISISTTPRTKAFFIVSFNYQKQIQNDEGGDRIEKAYT
jgi:hypothetical protein